MHLMEAVEDDDGNVTMVPVIDDGRPALSQEALARREALIEKMALLPAVPGVLDALLEAFGTDAVAEITGRSRRVVVRDGRRVVERRSGMLFLGELEYGDLSPASVERAGVDPLGQPSRVCSPYRYKSVLVFAKSAESIA